MRRSDRHPAEASEKSDRITELRPSVRVLYMSGYARPVLADQGTLDPGVALVEKPFTEHTLLAAVRAVLDDDGAVPPGSR